MAAIKNSLDKILQASVPRFAAPTDRAFFVNPEQAIFKVTNGIASPSSFNFTPTLLNMSGTVSYVPSAGLAISVADNKFSLAYSDMTVPSGSVVATLVVDGVTYTRTILVSRIIDGVAPKLLDLAASSQVFKVDEAGAGAPGSIELIAKGQNLAGTPNFTILSGAAQLTIGSDATRKQLTFANMATDLVQVQVAQDGQVDTVTIVKVREGQNGVDALVGFLSNEAHTIPANLDGTPISVGGAQTYMQVYRGIIEDTSNWTFSASPPSDGSSGLAYVWDNFNTMHITGMAAGVDAASLMITASRPGFSSISKVFSIAKSKTGPMGPPGTGSAGKRGNVNLSVVTSGGGWSDAEANAAVVNFTGTSPMARDVVNLYRADRIWAQKRVFDGFNWYILADAFDGAILVKGSVISDSLATGAVTARTLAVGAVTASSMLIGSPDNCVLDPDINDPAWWTLADQPAGVYFPDYAYGNVPWKSRRTVLFPANGNRVDRSTQMFPMAPGATYLAEYSAYLSGDFNGVLTFVTHLPGQAWFPMGGPSRGYPWSAEEGGLPVNFDVNSPKGFFTFRDPFTMANTTQQARAQLRVIAKVYTGYIEIGGVSITRMADDALVVNGGIKARHIEVNNLSAISSIVTARVGGGAGIDQDANGIRIYDGSGVRRLQLGNLDV
jgi:hypothetical protein